MNDYISDDVIVDLLGVTDGSTRLVSDRLSLRPFFASGGSSGHLRLDLLQLAMVNDIHDAAFLQMVCMMRASL